MKVFGVTGGVGMGKSACGRLLAERGFKVIDTDLLARKVVEPGQPSLAKIQEVFGTDIVDESGALLRHKLAARVFVDPLARQTLEGILHPPIRALWKEQISLWAAAGGAVAFVIIPLLFETQAERELDATLCIACSEQTQFRRLAARGWTPNQIQQRIRAQLPTSAKIDSADFVIWSEGSLAVHAQQLEMLLARLVPA